ncbi:nicotianamine aminotransferase 1-like isoform X1 [Punica granatum]|uniref:Nicotianamine aminotransferase 1-like isoform X1 n=1 Tax=Punica granatum TaxID=22663 RepID=A0A6P8CYC9_PUNGR|nr:nicotianamine aminotransferase 1-like isoform X1 [Punica granatum]XP_031389798.1 nicotianamine aminotransferase 1-like isoform X1 [Punica granatum]XP_031389799.1 nicotianamine aminotransferase 1-like isoform X1 [Punica granatum]
MGEVAKENWSGQQKWRFERNEVQSTSSAATIRMVRTMLMGNLRKDDPRTIIPFAHGDPSSFPSFRTAAVAEDAIVDTLRSGKFNTYATTSFGIPPARRAIAESLSKDLPYTLSPDDVFLTVGCTQAIEVIISVLAGRPGANVLLPRPGYPYYETCASFSKLKVRHFDLLPDKGWEVDLAGVEKLADENTMAMVIINPGNPCGNVFSYEHLKQVAETAKKLGIMVIADEVYAHLAFGNTPFTPMGVFGSIAPVLTLGSISKRWIVPGWRLGWLVTTDPNGILKKSGVVESIKEFLTVASDPATFIQGAIPRMLENSTDDFFSRIIVLLKHTADMCYDRFEQIPCIICSSKPEGSMFVMVKLNLSMLDGIEDDLDFSLKLAKEESVIVLPGIAVGMKNWLRVTFAIEPASLVDGMERIKAFCERHAKKQ